MRKTFLSHNETAQMFAETPKHLILPLELEMGVDSRFYNRFLKITSLLLLFAIIWASISPIQELAIAQGQIMPSGSLRSVQHLEGGIISEILVKEGEIVEVDQPLLRIEPTAADSDLGQLRMREQSLILQKKRLEALAKGQSFDPVSQGLVSSSQLNAFEATGQFRKEEQKTIETRVAQRRSEFEAARQEMASFKRQLGIYEEQLSIRQKLYEQGFSSKKALLESQAQLETIKIQFVNSSGKAATTKQALAEAEQQLSVSFAIAKRDDSNDGAKITSELVEVQETIKKLQDRVARLDVKSPIKGVVQLISPKSIGEVVRPGDVIAKVVPVDRELMAEVQVSPDYIGHIKPGTLADVKIGTFDSSIYGVLKAEVRSVSASTFQTEKGEMYYKVSLKLEKNYVGPVEHRFAISPGMTVSAEIITGSKSMMKYLLKPVYKSLGLAFSER